MKTFLALIVSVVAVSANAVALDETVTEIENRILRTALAKVGETRMTGWSGVGCSAWDVVTCAGALAGTIAACVASGITWGAALAECIAGIIGTGDACWQCVCDVIEWLGMGSC
eukprot:TRINITY_DN12700_c0_g1_i1.p2 TRINITY_DN12700_c0_g1~~TRINITY_DN12700_c0_g1_i1.p2  ORF type:complete len:114 (-),score=19.91 TRINITY_DN12700_c0_g1_i1:125-466(-)